MKSNWSEIEPTPMMKFITVKTLEYYLGKGDIHTLIIGDKVFKRVDDAKKSKTNSLYQWVKSYNLNQFR